MNDRKKKRILFSEHDTCLIENAVGETYIFPFGLTCSLDDLHLSEGDVICLGKSHHVGGQNRSTAGKTTDRETSLDDSFDSTPQFETLLQGIFGSAGIIAPVAFLHLGGLGNIKIDITFEGQTL